MSDNNLQAPLLQTLVDRGFLHQCTDLAMLDEHCSQKPICAYIGFDCTADSLHVGNLVTIMLLRWLQRFGHKPIVLLGGGTTKVGDPSGKDTARKLLTNAVIEENKQGIAKVFNKFLTFGDGPADAIILDNAQWLDSLMYVPFLRDVGKHFSVNRLLSFESVSARLEREQPLSFLEFNYVLLQSYDFVELHRRYGCTLQLGGSDQWGNIVSGIDLGRRVLQQPLFGWTAPLITTASGAKMGKSEQGAVWLDADKYSVYDYWQFWRNTSDADVALFLKLFTELPLAQIEAMTSVSGQAINEAKIMLADCQTAMCHGAEQAALAKKTAEKTFVQAGLGEDLPQIKLDFASQEQHLLTKIIVDCGFAGSNSQARRLIQQAAVKLDGVTVDDAGLGLTVANFSENKVIKLSCGKKKFAAIEMINNG